MNACSRDDVQRDHDTGPITKKMKSLDKTEGGGKKQKSPHTKQTDCIISRDSTYID